jgi:hypothetical protein
MRRNVSKSEDIFDVLVVLVFVLVAPAEVAEVTSILASQS